MRALVLAVLFSALVVAPAKAAGDEAMRLRWLAEAQRLDALQADYRASSDEQAKTLKALEAARAAVDTAIADPSVTAQKLRELEDKLTDARDDAMHQAEDAAAVRRHIYDQIELLEQLGAEVEGAGSAPLVADAGVAGTWRAEWDGAGGQFGIVRLESSGQLVKGTFRLTDGNAGSVNGSLGGDELRLEVINSSKGFTGNVLAQVAPDGDSITGTWMAVDVAGARRAVATLRLTRLSDDAASSLLRGMR